MNKTIELCVEGSALTETKPFTVAIIGGGVAGSTVALKLSGLGVNTVLLEAGNSLVSGPPICHLHAGGNLYREISEQQCVTLLEQSIATVRAYPHSVNRRPTVIAIPKADAGEPESMLSRLQSLTAHYKKLVEEDPENAVLGDPETYYTLFSKADLERLATYPLPESPKTPEEWLIPIAHYMPHDNFKYPLVVVQEYGLSVFRLAAIAALGLEQSSLCELKLGHQVTDLVKTESGWLVKAKNATGEDVNVEADFVVNAAGFRSGLIDDITELPRARWVEYKAAYVAHWPSKQGQWPEVIVHGERGTPQGMAQLTPYPQGFIQLHGMTQNITLFDGGLVKSDTSSAYPPLPASMVKKAGGDWDWREVRERTSRAIAHFSQWLPAFEMAEVGGKPLCGAQQVPGDDPSLRAADASFEGTRYARVEIVKASSALQAADRILAHLAQHFSVVLPSQWDAPSLPLTANLLEREVVEKAKQLTALRGYPEALAIPFPQER